jgi:hypothetical protein|tara:strand:+ start:171 stop:509 length:339 start_codon:yes stop_codon:yes gene_type:complete
MFKTKIIISTIIFLILLIVTSIIKNKTRIIEKKSFKLNKKITLKKQDINESQLDFHFLTSPAEIEKKVKILGQNNYSPIKKSNIFLSLSTFNSIQNQITILNNKNEKTNKRN